MQSPRILIVEDSFIVSLHLQTTLQNEGYQVEDKCSSGEEALLLLEHSKPDLILMDIMLNGTLDGVDTAKVIKEKYHIPVVYITALSDKNTIQRAKVTEPYGYLRKPFEDREIFTVIEMALYKHDIESRLRQSEEKYFSTVNSISDAVITINREYEIVYLNPSAAALLQCSAHDALGKRVTEVLKLKNEVTQETDVNPVQCSIGMGVDNKMPDHLVLIGMHGKEVPIGESSLSPLFDNKGNFVGLIIIFKNIAEKRAHDKLVSEMELKRKAALIEGQEKERARIAKDLHDGLGQMLNAIKMNARLMLTDKQEANSIYSLLDEAIIESVRISENLLPAKLRDFDLAICLKSFSAQLRESTHTNISFSDLSTQSSTQQIHKVNLYRIVQEAVNNSIKHAHAQTITIQLSEEIDCLRLSIEDDGQGMTNVQEKRQNGLINMHDRAEVMGGKLTIESDPKRGTLIIVEIPNLTMQS